MPRRRFPDTVRKELLLPRALVKRVDRWLFDATTGKPRYGGWSHYLERLIRRDLARYNRDD